MSTDEKLPPENVFEDSERQKEFDNDVATVAVYVKALEQKYPKLEVADIYAALGYQVECYGLHKLPAELAFSKPAGEC